VRTPDLHIARRGVAMADRTYAISEIVGTSPVDVNSAIRNGIKRANETVRNLDWFELVEVRGAIMNGEVNHYQVTLKVGFRLEDTQE
jgi:dodecin